MIANRASQHNFAKGPDANIARSVFDRSFEVKDTYNFDYNYPIFCDEILPCDDVNLTIDAFIRLSSFALKVPVMEQMFMKVDAFFVPNRLLWTNWEKFNGAQDIPGDSTSYTMLIMILVAAFTVVFIFDKFGLPTDIANVPVINTLPLRAYIKIYNDWYRDENLVNSVSLPTGDGPDTQANFTLKKRLKQKDYFTGGLSWSQIVSAVSFFL